MIHWLKSSSPRFNDLWDQFATFELRKNDRIYEEDDIVVIVEKDTEHKAGSAERALIANINWIVRDAEGLKRGWVILNLHIVARVDEAKGLAMI